MYNQNVLPLNYMCVATDSSKMSYFQVPKPNFKHHHDAGQSYEVAIKVRIWLHIITDDMQIMHDYCACSLVFLRQQTAEHCVKVDIICLHTMQMLQDYEANIQHQLNELH